jgi:hypothetical protein
VNHLAWIVLAALLGSVGSAQTTTVPPVGAEGAAAPASGGALVRFVHAAPNAGTMQVAVRSPLAAIGDPESVVELAYTEMTDYVSFFEGSFELVVDLVDDADGVPLVLPQTLDTVRGRSYTVALVGLTTGDRTVARDDEGFLAWLEGLFTPARPELGLRALVLDDLAAVPLAPQEIHLRIVHAAPGTTGVELVHVANGAVQVLDTVGYLDVSGFHTVLPEVGRFEIRAVGSDVPIVDLGDVAFAGGRVHTVLFVGTPIEQVPLQAIVASNDWVDPRAIPPVAPTIGGLMTMGEVIWIRDLLLEVDVHLVAADGRLGEPAAAPPDVVGAARRDLVAARDLLEQALLELDAAERRGVVTPGAPPPALPGAPQPPPAAPGN